MAFSTLYRIYEVQVVFVKFRISSKLDQLFSRSSSRSSSENFAFRVQVPQKRRVQRVRFRSPVVNCKEPSIYAHFKRLSMQAQTSRCQPRLLGFLIVFASATSLFALRPQIEREKKIDLLKRLKCE